MPPIRLSYRRRNQLRDQLRRRSPPLLVALALWLAWGGLSLVLYRQEPGPLLALLLLGGLILLGGAYALLWLRRDLRRERAGEAAHQQDFAWLSTQIHPRHPLPLPTGGMAKPALLIATWQLILEERPRRILELGSGLSTLVMAYALERVGQGELVSLENEAQYAAHTRRWLAEHQLLGQNRVTVLDAPLRLQELQGEEHPWYDLEALDATSLSPPFDLLFVDGPAGFLAPMIRYPALPLLREHLATDALILFDDSQRRNERRIIARWLTQFPELQKDEGFAQKGFSLFRLASPDGP